MKLYIRNMVCDRCKQAVGSVIIASGLHPLSLKLGEVEIQEELEKKGLLKLNERLVKAGFSLIDDKKGRLSEKVKTAIVEMVHYSSEMPKVNLSKFLSDLLNLDYSYISNLFKEQEGLSIEQFVIAQKIERVKELLTYDELTLQDIADRLQYSSVAWLSNQFKKETGATPGQYRKTRNVQRLSLDHLHRP